MTFDIEQSVGFLLAKSHQRIFSHFRKKLLPFGLTPPQFALLAFLWKRDDITQIELSQKTEVDRTTISGIVDRLVRDGLVERRPNLADRRAHLICLTAKGRALKVPLEELALQTRHQVGADLAPGEYEKLCELLTKLSS